MIKITLILALRDQDDIFKNVLMKSLVETTSNPGSVEIIVVIDEDDLKSKCLLDDCINEYPFNIRYLITPRSYWFIRDYYNPAKRQAEGRWIMILNADSCFKTKNWDKILHRKMSSAARKFGDDILYGVVNDGLIEKDHNINFSCWCLSSKEYVNVMGGIMDERIAMWGADVSIGKLFNIIDNGRRKVQIPEIFIDHMSHHVYKTINPSRHIKRFHFIQSRMPSFLTDEQMAESADKINRYLRSKK